MWFVVDLLVDYTLHRVKDHAFYSLTSPADASLNAGLCLSSPNPHPRGQCREPGTQPSLPAPSFSLPLLLKAKVIPTPRAGLRGVWEIKTALNQYFVERTKFKNGSSQPASVY